MKTEMEEARTRQAPPGLLTTTEALGAGVDPPWSSRQGMAIRTPGSLASGPGPWCHFGCLGPLGLPRPGELFLCSPSGRSRTGSRPGTAHAPFPRMERVPGPGRSRGQGQRGRGARDSRPVALGRWQALVIREGTRGCLLKTLPRASVGSAGRHVRE